MYHWKSSPSVVMTAFFGTSVSGARLESWYVFLFSVAGEVEGFGQVQSGFVQGQMMDGSP